MKRWLIDHQGSPPPLSFFDSRGFGSPVVVDTTTKEAWYWNPLTGPRKLRFAVAPAPALLEDKPILFDVKYSDKVPTPELFGDTRGRGTPLVIDHTSDKAYYLSALSEVKEVTAALSFDSGIRFGDRYLLVVPGSFNTRITYTSQPYPAINEEAINITHTVIGGRFSNSFVEESLNVSHAVLSGAIFEPLKVYSNWPNESIDISHTLINGTLVQVLLTYDKWPIESIDVEHAVIGGNLVVVLITYDNWPAESIDVTHTVISGTLT
jgi:hypothetical protein